MTGGFVCCKLWLCGHRPHPCLARRTPGTRPLDNMSAVTYNVPMNPTDKPLIWLAGQVATPPMSKEARLEAGYLLRLLQAGRSLAMPHSRPMPAIGKRCHELRIPDQAATWRIFYRVDADAVLILEVLQKKTPATPEAVIDLCKQRAAAYGADSGNEA